MLRIRQWLVGATVAPPASLLAAWAAGATTRRQNATCPPTRSTKYCVPCERPHHRSPRKMDSSPDPVLLSAAGEGPVASGRQDGIDGSPADSSPFLTKKGDRSWPSWSGREVKGLKKVSTQNGLATRVLLKINMVLIKSNLRM